MSNNIFIPSRGFIKLGMKTGNFGKNTDYFRLTGLDYDKTNKCYLLDEELYETLGFKTTDKIKELDVFLLFNNINEILQINYKFIQKNEVVCFNGVIKKSGKLGNRGDILQENCENCDFLKSCTKEATLNLGLTKVKELGAAFQLKTKSYYGIRRLQGTLFKLLKDSAGQIAFIPLKLRVVKQQTTKGEKYNADLVFIGNIFDLVKEIKEIKDKFNAIDPDYYKKLTDYNRNINYNFESNDELIEEIDEDTINNSDEEVGQITQEKTDIEQFNEICHELGYKGKIYEKWLEKFGINPIETINDLMDIIFNRGVETDEKENKTISDIDSKIKNRTNKGGKVQNKNDSNSDRNEIGRDITTDKKESKKSDQGKNDNKVSKIISKIGGAISESLENQENSCENNDTGKTDSKLKVEKTNETSNKENKSVNTELQQDTGKTSEFIELLSRCKESGIKPETIESFENMQKANNEQTAIFIMKKTLGI